MTVSNWQVDRCEVGSYRQYRRSLVQLLCSYFCRTSAPFGSVKLLNNCLVKQDGTVSIDMTISVIVVCLLIDGAICHCLISWRFLSPRVVNCGYVYI